MTAEPQLRSRLLKNTDAIEWGNDPGGQAMVKLGEWTTAEGWLPSISGRSA